MTCKTLILGPNVQVIACSRTQREYCKTCQRNPAVTTCGFALKGRMEGKTCGALLCSGCAQSHEGVVLCGPHYRLATRTP